MTESAPGNNSTASEGRSVVPLANCHVGFWLGIKRMDNLGWLDITTWKMKVLWG